MVLLLLIDDPNKILPLSIIGSLSVNYGEPSSLILICAMEYEHFCRSQRQVHPCEQ